MRETGVVLALLLFCVAECFGQQSTITWARVRVEGPLAGLVLTTPAGTTRADRHWLVGEAQILVLPLLLESDAPRHEPRIDWDVGPATDSGPRGRARFEGWEGAGREPLAEVPLALRSRPPAPLAEEAPAVGFGSFALLGGLLILSLAARRSRRLGLGLALAGGAVVWFSGPRSDEPRVHERSVLEGLSGSTTWLRVRTVDGARGLRLPEPARSCALEPARAGARISISERDGVWYAGCVGDLRERSAVAAPDPWPALAECWRREDGVWSYRGAWPAGAPLPPVLVGPAPPGWLAAGLPQGVGVTLGRIEAQRWLCVSEP